MPRPLWNGSLSFGLVNVPVQLTDPATIERITALLRTTATAAPARPRAAKQPETSRSS